MKIIESVSLREFHKRATKYHDKLVALNTQFNGFVSGDYEVRFLQDDRLTVCVIRNLHKLDEKYTGISVLHPGEEFDAAIGRHKAFKKALEGFQQPINHYGLDWGNNRFGKFTFVKWAIAQKYPMSINSYINPLPISQLQKDYWRRYEMEEK